MSKIAILIHRYGNEVVGGAESYAKALAEHLAEVYQVSVITTTCSDYVTWENYYQNGTEMQDGVEVIRFSTERPRDSKFAEMCNQLAPRLERGEDSNYKEDCEWVEKEGPYCPEMVQYLEKHHDSYDAFIFITYIYYIAVKGIPAVFDRAIFIPTAHDETWLRLSVMKDLFRMPRYFGFLTEEEQALVHERFQNDYIPSDVLGIGIDIPDSLYPKAFTEKFHIDAPYLIYVGRIDKAKGCDELIEFFLSYKKRHPSNLKLVMVGKGNMSIPESDDIVVTGFVSEQEKFDAISGAFAMVTPSKYESLCISLLESLALKVPVIANANCAVLKGQCIRSNAGLYYTNEQEFELVLDYLLAHPEVYSQMGENGLKYIEKRYKWDKVVNKVQAMVENICKTGERMKEQVSSVRPEKHKLLMKSFDEQIVPIHENAITVVTSSDDNYADFVGVTINSIMLNASSDQIYDIIILTNDITDKSIRKIIGTFETYKNINIRFVYLSSVIQKMNIKISNNYNEVTYFRLLIPQMMKAYKKIIYLDSDVVINKNLEYLWNTELGENLLGAAIDSLCTAWQSYDSGPQAYFKALGLDTVGHYIQAGVLIWNIEQMNSQFPMNYLLQKSCDERFLLADQDILNIECKDKIVFINQAWNVINYTKEVWEYCKEHLPRWLMREEVKAIENPNAIHFCESSFPCWKQRGFDGYYWKYAWGTVFYDELLRRRWIELDKLLLKDNSDNFESMQPDNGDMLPLIKYDEKVEKCDMLILHGGGKIWGPNVFVGKGIHKAVFVCEMPETALLKVKIMAGVRRIPLSEGQLHNGRQEIQFECINNQIDLEFLIENNTREDIHIKELLLE